MKTIGLLIVCGFSTAVVFNYLFDDRAFVPGLIIGCIAVLIIKQLRTSAQRKALVVASRSQQQNSVTGRVTPPPIRQVDSAGSRTSVGAEFRTPVSSGSAAESLASRPPVLPQTPASELSEFKATWRSHTLQWVPFRQATTVDGYQIPGGLIYLSKGDPSIPEASAINTRLAVGRPIHGADAQLPYYPQYSALSPDQRATYLEWLAAGRTDVAPKSRELGYVFLFFYGLERRLLAEDQNDPEVIHAIERLLLIYGETGRSKSLPNYASQLLHFWGWRQGPQTYSKIWPWILAIKNSLLNDDMLAMVLANQFQNCQPLDEDLAYEVIAHDDRSRKSTVIERVNKEFQMLFKKRYLEKFPGGMTLKCGKRDRKATYRPASPTLMNLNEEIRIPDVLGISSQFKPLVTIWDSCVEDLSAYSRARAGSSDEFSLRAAKALPEELRGLAGHPLAGPWSDLFKKFSFEPRSAIIPAGEIASFISLPKREKLTLGQSRDLAQAVESLGFCIEPDARYSGCTYAWNEKLGIFKPADEQSLTPSPSCLAASALLQLCVLIAAADGNIQKEELAVIQEFLEKNLQLTPADQQRLKLLARLLVKDSEMAARTAAKIAKRIPAEKRPLVGDVLVLVAAADNVISNDELHALRRVFKMLEIPQEALDATIRKIRPGFDEVQIQKAAPRQPGEKIPAEAKEDESLGFVLDEARIKAIHDETREVISILAEVMEEQEEEFTSGLPAMTSHPVADGSGGAAESVAVVAEEKTETPAWMEALEAKFRPVILKLITRSSWSRKEFEALAAEFCLMPLSVYDEIQQWSDEALGDFLLEGDDPIEIHTELLPEEQ